MQKRYQWIDYSYKYMTLTLHFNSRDISTVLNILLRDGGKIQAVEELIIRNQREWVIWSGAYFQLLNPKTTHVIFKNEYQIQFSWMLASAAVSHVIILATALLPACLYVTVFSSYFQASPTSPGSLDPSRHIVVQPLPHRPIIMLCVGSKMERMAIVDISASR